MGAGEVGERLTEVSAVTGYGDRARWPEEPTARARFSALPAVVRRGSDLAADVVEEAVALDAVVDHGDDDQLRELCKQVAARDGAIVSVQGFARGESNLLLERLLIERSLSVNTAAAGGNASLMTIG